MISPEVTSAENEVIVSHMTGTTSHQTGNDNNRSRINFPRFFGVLGMVVDFRDLLGFWCEREDLIPSDDVCACASKSSQKFYPTFFKIFVFFGYFRFTVFDFWFEGITLLQLKIILCEFAGGSEIDFRNFRCFFGYCRGIS